LGRARAITIYATRTGGAEPIAKAIEEGREETGVEVISRGTVNAKGLVPKTLMTN
jgi:flavodoxin